MKWLLLSIVVFSSALVGYADAACVLFLQNAKQIMKSANQNAPTATVMVPTARILTAPALPDFIELY